ncbi:MAG: CBS domain-containing protein [Candidatus Limnocylindrales bacterium]
MICPSCGFENIQGADECENCGADLRTVDVPGSGTAFETKLVGVPLTAVHADTPMMIASTATAADAVRQMQRASIGCLIVADDGGIRGILSERDLVLKAHGTELNGTTVGSLMTADPVVLRPDDSVAVAIHKMAVGGFRHIPLVIDGQATGIVSAHDLFRYILDALQ